jgi:hypothetical protein
MRALLERTAPIHGPLLFIGGGLWDYATLRLERLADNALLLLYLVVYAAITALDLRRLDGAPLPSWLATRPRVITLVGQFVLGGLLSAYFVHYLRGAPIQRELIWLTLLALLAVGNELADRRPQELPLVRLPLLAFVAFNYLLAVLPLLTGKLVGPLVPLLGAIGLVAATVRAASAKGPLGDHATRAWRASLVAFAVQLGLIAADLVPPLPLTLVSAEVQADAEGDLYELSAPRELLAPVGLFRPKLRWEANHAVRVRTPIYLPAAMTADVVHRWQRLTVDGWVDTDRIALAIHGGREAGFRTWSLKRRTEPGRWRVIVETPDGRELGRVHFDLVERAGG